MKAQTFAQSEQLYADFVATLQTNRELVRLYKNKGLQHPLIMSAFVTFVDQQHADFMTGCLSFDDFISMDAESIEVGS